MRNKQRAQRVKHADLSQSAKLLSAHVFSTKHKATKSKSTHTTKKKKHSFATVKKKQHSSGLMSVLTPHLQWNTPHPSSRKHSAQRHNKVRRHQHREQEAVLSSVMDQIAHA